MPIAGPVTLRSNVNLVSCTYVNEWIVDSNDINVTVLDGITEDNSSNLI